MASEDCLIGKVDGRKWEIPSLLDTHDYIYYELTFLLRLLIARTHLNMGGSGNHVVDSTHLPSCLQWDRV